MLLVCHLIQIYIYKYPIILKIILMLGYKANLKIINI